MRLNAVVFDLFGTLVSSSPWRKYRPVVDQMANLLGLPADQFYSAFNRKTRLERELGRFASLEDNLARVSRALGVEPHPDALTQAAQLRRDFVATVLEPRPDTLPLLRHLETLGLKLGLISDASPEVPDLFARTEMAPLIQTAVFSSQVGKKKPDPELYQRACEGLGVKPGAVVYVGDGGSNELSGATSFGMRAVLILPEGETFGRDEYRPEALTWKGDTVTRLWELASLIEQRGWV